MGLNAARLWLELAFHIREIPCQKFGMEAMKSVTFPQYFRENFVRPFGFIVPEISSTLCKLYALSSLNQEWI
jgi:hypothetical protein